MMVVIYGCFNSIVVCTLYFDLKKIWLMTILNWLK